jgi:hypothetical protein
MRFTALRCLRALSQVAVSGSPVVRSVVQMVVFSIMLSIISDRTDGATTTVTINNTNPLVAPFLPSAVAGSQVGNSPAWKAGDMVLGLTTFTEGLEVLTPAAAVDLNYATQRTKRITLGQDTVLTPINIPAASTNIETMLVEVVGNGVWTLAFNSVTFQTPLLSTPPAGVVTFYGLRADSGIVRGYCDPTVTFPGGLQGPLTPPYIPMATTTTNLTDSFLSQPAGIDLTDNRVSTGTNIVLNITSGQVLTNGDKLVSIGNAGVEVDSISATGGGIAIGASTLPAWGGTLDSGESLVSIRDVTLGDANNSEVFLKTKNGADEYSSIDANTGTQQGNLNIQSTGTNGTWQVTFATAQEESGNPFVKMNATSPGGVLWTFEPSTADGMTPYVLDTSIAHTTGNMIELANATTLEFAVAAGSGYTGVGTKFLSDDGTYKSSTFTNVEDEVWINQAGVVRLVPGNTNYVVSILSQSPDDATNAVLVVDTDSLWTQGTPVQIKNNGTKWLQIGPKGGITRGPNTESLYGLAGDEIFIQLNDVSAGDPDASEFFAGIYSDTAGTVQAAFDFIVHTNEVILSLAQDINSGGFAGPSFTAHIQNDKGTNGVSRIDLGDWTNTLRFQAEPTAAATLPAYILDTSRPHTTGNLLEVSNMGTNVAFVNFRGDAAFGTTKFIRLQNYPSLNGAAIFADTGQALYLGANANAQSDVEVTSTNFRPVTDNARGLGATNARWSEGWFTNTTTVADFQTGDPGGGTALWRLGKVVTGATVALTLTNYVEVMIGGSVKKLALVQ